MAQALQEKEKSLHLDSPIAWCPVCWADRILTTNGKCKTCGAKLEKRHWNNTIKKLKIIKDNPNSIPLEILGKLYFIPKAVVDDFNPNASYKDNVSLVERIKKQCPSERI